MCQPIVCHCVFLPLESPHPPGPPVDRPQGSGENVSVYMECVHPSTFTVVLYVLCIHVVVVMRWDIKVAQSPGDCLHVAYFLVDVRRYIIAIKYIAKGYKITRLWISYMSPIYIWL